MELDSSVYIYGIYLLSNSTISFLKLIPELFTVYFGFLSTSLNFLMCFRTYVCNIKFATIIMYTDLTMFDTLPKLDLTITNAQNEFQISLCMKITSDIIYYFLIMADVTAPCFLSVFFPNKCHKYCWYLQTGYKGSWEKFQYFISHGQ